MLIISGKPETEEDEVTLEDAISLAKVFIGEGMGISMAAKTAAKQTGLKKGDIYKALQEEEE